MDVTLFTTDGPIYVPRSLDPVFDRRGDHTSRVVFAPDGTDLLDEVRDRWAMFGPAGFPSYARMYAVNEALDLLPTRIARGLTGRYHSVRSLAEAYDIPVVTVSDVNSSAFVSAFRRWDPDLGPSIACGQRLGEEVLDVPDRGCIDVHGSLLPDYRGLATAFWVLYHDEDESGVTAHYTTPEFDDGPIVGQRRYAIDPDDSMHDLYLRLLEEGPRLAVDVIDDVREGDAETRPNDPSEGEYYSLPSRADREEFLRRGNEFV